MAFERELARAHELDGVRPADQLARAAWTDGPRAHACQRQPPVCARPCARRIRASRNLRPLRNFERPPLPLPRWMSPLQDGVKSPNTTARGESHPGPHDSLRRASMTPDMVLPVATKYEGRYPEGMDIAKLSISLPSQQAAWIEEQVRSGAYGNRSEYVRELIRNDQRRREIDALRSKLLSAKASLDAGQGREATDAWFEEQLAKLETDSLPRPPRPKTGA
jgi:antitoxin ParD1/3/4